MRSADPVVAGRPLSDWLSPDTKRGCDTVLGHLARVNPEALALIPDVVEDTKRDGIGLLRDAALAGKRVFKVTAPPVLQERGITTVIAYPLPLLIGRFGV